MPSPAQTLLNKGFALRQRTHKEIVTFKDEEGEFTVTINRENKSQDPKAGIEISTEEGSTIEFPLDVGRVPVAGDVMVDEFDFEHCVKTVKHVGHALKCECEVTR